MTTLLYSQCNDSMQSLKTFTIPSSLSLLENVNKCQLKATAFLLDTNKFKTWFAMISLLLT